MTIGDRIRLKREELGMTQEELAKKLGYANRSSVNKVENSRELSNKKVKLFADALNTTPAYLMGWEDVSWNYKTQEISVKEDEPDNEVNYPKAKREVEEMIEAIRRNPEFASRLLEYAEFINSRVLKTEKKEGGKNEN